MKSSSFPSVRVEPDLRQAAEKVLREGESLSSFVEQSIRHQVRQRELQHQFIERGLSAGKDSQATGEYYSAEEVLAELDQILSTARSK
jgi:predicted transcriptional regulator